MKSNSPIAHLLNDGRQGLFLHRNEGKQKKEKGSNLWPDRHTCRAAAAETREQRRSLLTAGCSGRQRRPPQTSSLAAHVVYRERRETRGLPGRPDPPPSRARRPPRSTRSHPAISGQRGGRPGKMSTGPAVNPAGCSVISGGPRRGGWGGGIQSQVFSGRRKGVGVGGV